MILLVQNAIHKNDIPMLKYLVKIYLNPFSHENLPNMVVTVTIHWLIFIFMLYFCLMVRKILIKYIFAIPQLI
jgi:hypothetical protein